MPREIPKPVRPGPGPSPEPKCVPVRPQTDYTDLKIKTLAENIAKTYIPYALKNSENIEEITIDNVSEEAYIYLDNNGNPTKLLATTVLKKEIDWNDLSPEAKQHILDLINQNKLKAGNHITITNNTINADIGVETINGKTGNVSLTASDVNAYTKSETYNKNETYSKNDVYNKDEACSKQDLADALDGIDITIDGGVVK